MNNPHPAGPTANMKDPHVESRIKALRCLLSPVTKQVMNEMIEQFFFDCGSDVEEYDYTVDQGYRPGHLTIQIHHKGGDELYDWIMNQSRTSIGEDIWYYASKKMVFVSHDTELTINFSIHCPLPEDDFKTLDMLGKVHREYKPGKFETSIFCEV